jgi:hypothetical protein
MATRSAAGRASTPAGEVPADPSGVATTGPGEGAGAGPAPWSPLTAGEKLTGAADPGLRTRPLGLVEHLHRARYALVRRLLWLLAGVLAGGVGMLLTTRWTRLTADEVSDFVTMVFGATVALVGCAVGFYFGSDGRRD